MAIVSTNEFKSGLKVLLEREGFEVVAEASDGHEAVQLAARVKPDVAVVDFVMPLLNGLDAARWCPISGNLATTK
jgi:DNA-binding NarL/FixJ family response regulator